jgi:hypothetical protein
MKNDLELGERTPKEAGTAAMLVIAVGLAVMAV